MTFIPILPLTSTDPAADAFGRLRTSEPVTIFDTKQLFDNVPLLWDDVEESGSGTTSVHSADTASSVLGVSATTAGVRTRQTFMRFNYQPGKSQQVLMTGTLAVTGGGTGITTAFGLFDDDNGIFWQERAGVVEVVRRTNVTGSPVDEIVAQSSWNLDVMDGTGASGFTLDETTSQILSIDLEWLGAGRARIGLVIDGETVYVHQFLGANVRDGVYMSTPNLPLRYQIENGGAGAASTMRSMCGTVVSESGANSLGVLHTFSTAGTALTASTSGTLYALMGFRLKTTHLGCTVNFTGLSVIATTNDDFEWGLYFNATVASTFGYADQTNSCLQAILGVTANTVSGGTLIVGGFSQASEKVEIAVPPALRLGASVAGDRDTLVLAVRPLSNNASIQGTTTRREIL